MDNLAERAIIATVVFLFMAFSICLITLMGVTIYKEIKYMPAQVIVYEHKE